VLAGVGVPVVWGSGFEGEEDAGDAEAGGVAAVGEDDAADGCVCVPPSGRVERKAIERPSGDQRGELEDCGLVVSCRGGRLPSVATSQI